MEPEIWNRVETYLDERLLPEDPVLEAAVRESHAAGLPAIQVTPSQGRLLQIFVRILEARRILEIGTLGGYSAIWMARALPPEGRLVSLEREERHAAVARRNIARAGLQDRVEIRVGPALETLPMLEREPHDPFDLVFIDADKESNPDYFDWGVRLARPGGLIVVDNVVRHGTVLDAASPDPDIQGTRRLFNRVRSEPRVMATTVQTVGSKSYDGFLFALIIG